MTLWAQSRRARGVRSTARSAPAAARRAARGTKSGTSPSWLESSDPAPPAVQPVQELVLGDQPLLARVLGHPRHQQAPVGIARVVVPDDDPPARAASRGPSPRACRAPRRGRRCGASRPRSLPRRSCRPRRAWRCPSARTASTAGVRSRSTSSIPSDGSMPATSYPLAASRAASTPVPQPTSSARPPGQCACTKASRFCEVVLDDVGRERLVVRRRDRVEVGAAHACHRPPGSGAHGTRGPAPVSAACCA